MNDETQKAIDNLIQSCFFMLGTLQGEKDEKWNEKFVEALKLMDAAISQFKQ